MVVQQYSLRELRARKRLSQQEVADKIGISSFTYYRLENNNEALLNSKILTLIKLAELFEVEVKDIFLG